MNLKELLTGTPARLRYVPRFSTFRKSNTESVAEHSFYVALYALFICEFLRGTKVSMSADIEVAALCQSLLHDLEEAITGDMPRPFKHSSSALQISLSSAAEEAMRQAMLPLQLGERLTTRIYQHWKEAKQDTYAGRIVAFADFLSVLSYLAQESLDSNYSVAQHLVQMQAYYGTFLQERFHFLQGLVKQAGELMEELGYGPE